MGRQREQNRLRSVISICKGQIENAMGNKWHGCFTIRPRIKSSGTNKTGELLLFLLLIFRLPKKGLFGSCRSSISVRLYKKQWFHYLKMHEYYRVIQMKIHKSDLQINFQNYLFIPGRESIFCLVQNKFWSLDYCTFMQVICTYLVFSWPNC